ncbi:DUF5694 domain-containing protein [Brevundimonas sp. EYE_349]|uniref:DUF5694 domain-containing protein n=1 Tax=Brevundimonas sp. EYE_349 TaxID=2853455 RepID=UPI00200381A8|nr:DUF5694 domain-containing protein [Brevundimonas sp. EYE_349]MCK6103972.1 hypothetical protein [Brevundimonas sp. EYE_349]
MLKLLALTAALLVPSVALAQSPPPPQPIQVMVVGTFHFDNPGQDLNNVAVDPVTTPAKQAELAAVAEGLRRFHPTAIALEREATDTTTLLDQMYPAFTTAALASDPDERIQIAYRLANLEKIDRVYAIDEQPGEGERDYFPFGPVGAWIETHHREADVEALNATVAASSADLAARQRTETLGALLADTNRRDHPVHGGQSLYYGLLGFGDAVSQHGAELNAGWYERNAKIFAKLMMVAKPGDRIVIVYGAGHAYWLRHFIENTPGFQLVDPAPYLAGT